jgi:hypothetical protein
LIELKLYIANHWMFSYKLCLATFDFSPVYLSIVTKVCAFYFVLHFKFPELFACLSSYEYFHIVTGVWSHIGGVMDSVLVLSARSGQNKDYQISICCLGIMWPCLSVDRSFTIKIQLTMLVLYKVDLIIVSLKINLFMPWYSRKIAELA